jgi:ribosomal protein S18 acetylase RimI-like enzyme
MSTVLYRGAAQTDIPSMARLRAATWGSEEYWTTRIAAYMNLTHAPRKALEPRVAYVAIINNSVAGFIAGHLTTRNACVGELQWIDVAREYQRGGIASVLLARLAAWFAQQNALRICVDVEPSNAIARAFYRKHGAVDLRKSWMVWEDIRTVLERA